MAILHASASALTHMDTVTGLRFSLAHKPISRLPNLYEGWGIERGGGSLRRSVRITLNIYPPIGLLYLRISGLYYLSSCH